MYIHLHRYLHIHSALCRSNTVYYPTYLINIVMAGRGVGFGCQMFLQARSLTAAQTHRPSNATPVFGVNLLIRTQYYFKTMWAEKNVILCISTKFELGRVIF